MGRSGIAIKEAINRSRERLATEQDGQRHLREVLVDIIIDADFTNTSVTAITDPLRIAQLKKVILQSDTPYRAYVASVADNPTFDDYRGVRRQLEIPLMTACDRYFDLSQLFHKYYHKLASDDFTELSKDRKIEVLNELCAIGTRTKEAHLILCQEMERSDKSRAIFNDVNAHLQKMVEHEKGIAHIEAQSTTPENGA